MVAFSYIFNIAAQKCCILYRPVKKYHVGMHFGTFFDSTLNIEFLFSSELILFFKTMLSPHKSTIKAHIKMTKFFFE